MFPWNKLPHQFFENLIFKNLRKMRGRGARNNLVPNRKRKRPDHSGDRGPGNNSGRVTGVTFKPRAPPAKNYMENYEPKNGCPLSYYIQSVDQKLQ